MIPQDPPFAVQIELVEGCSLSCEFCGINGIREKAGNFKSMSLDVVSTLADQLKHAINRESWNPRIEFAMHGEPSLHPDLCQAIEIFRKAMPKQSMVMFSNGTGFVKYPTELIDAVLGAGINTLGLDAYEHVNIVPRVLAGYKGRAPIYQYPAQKEHNLHSGRRVGHKDIVVIKDISKADTGNHSSLNTHCGGGMKPPTTVLVARCAKPFRELAIRWDGNIALCCNDFRGVYKCGNIKDDPLQVIWNNKFFLAARKKLYHHDRNFGACAPCNAKSMRVGLLPDQKGLYYLEPANAFDDELISQASDGEPYTAPVLRGWEINGETNFTALPKHTYPVNLYDKKRL